MTDWGESGTQRGWDQLLIPQTNVQLYRLLASLGYSSDALEMVRRTYEFGARVYSARYQGCGKPFVSHGVGTAGILAYLGAAPNLVAAALIHNVYLNGDLGGLHPKQHDRAQSVVQEAVGAEVEAYVDRFRTMRPGKFRGPASELDDLDRGVLLLHTAEMLEKMYDCGIAYWDVDVPEFLAAAETRAAVVNDLGAVELGSWLRQAVGGVRAERPLPALRNRPGSWVILPPSARLRRALMLKRAAWSALRAGRRVARGLARVVRGGT